MIEKARIFATAAHAAVGQDRKVKFRIVKKVEVEEIAEEVLGNEASFFMLKG